MPDSNRDEIEKLEELYASNPAGRVFTHLAEAYRKAGDLERASALLEAGLVQHPDYPSAYVVLGRVKLDREEREEAASAFRRVLELDRHNLIAIRALGDLAVEAGRFEEARHYLGELIQIDPSDLESAERLDQLPAEFGLEGSEPEAAWSEPEVEGWQAEVEETAVEALDPAPAEAPAEVPDDDEASAGVRSWGDVSIETAPAAEEVIESVSAPESSPDEAPAEETSAAGADEPAGGSAPLDAWVESLHVIDPDLEASTPELEADIVTLEAVESDDGTGTVWEVDPREEPVAEAETVVEGESTASGNVEDEGDGLMDLEVPEPEAETTEEGAEAEAAVEETAS